jgi:hypothetical protein
VIFFPDLLDLSLLLSSTGYLNHLGQWEEYPYVVSAEDLDAA